MGVCDPARLPRGAGLGQSLGMRIRHAVVPLLLLIAPGCGSREKTPDFPALLQALKSTDPAVRGPAGVELIAMGEKAAPSVAELLKDPDPRVRHMGAMTLQSMGARSAGATPALVEALGDTSAEVRTTAATALQAYGAEAAPAVPALMKALKDPEGIVRLEAVRALGTIGAAAEPALPLLTDMSRIEFLRQAADEAIKKIHAGAARKGY
jgi:HEAT repeat protein